MKILRCEPCDFLGAGDGEVHPAGVEEDAEVHFCGGRGEEGGYVGGEDWGVGGLHFSSLVFWRGGG